MVLGIFEFFVRRLVEAIARELSYIGGGIFREIAGGAIEESKKEIANSVKTASKDLRLKILKGDYRRFASEVTRFARNNNGELTTADLMAEYEMDKVSALKILDSLVEKKVCFSKERGNDFVYIFPAFKIKKKIKACEYCGNNYSDERVNPDCGTCGAPLVENIVFE
jgi:hypothetical protein